jgi:hypothetical protein
MGKTLITISQTTLAGINAAAMLIGAQSTSLSTGYNTAVGIETPTPSTAPKNSINFE